MPAGLEHESAAKYVGVVTIRSAGLDHEVILLHVFGIPFSRRVRSMVCLLELILLHLFGNDFPRRVRSMVSLLKPILLDSVGIFSRRVRSMVNLLELNLLTRLVWICF